MSTASQPPNHSATAPPAKVLTEKQILDKTKVPTLLNVRRLDLWGEGLTDVSVVEKLKNIEVLALAANHISSLRSFAQCQLLEELYLRKNVIASLREVTALKSLKKLHTLWLMDNPCSMHPYYREFVLHCCPNLTKLDNVAVAVVDRANAAKRLSPRVLDDILGRTNSVPSSSFSRASGGGAPQPTSASSRARPSTGAGAAPSSPPPLPVHPCSAVGATPSQPTSEERSGITTNSTSPTVALTTLQTQRAMLTAIVSLLPELTVESLELLEREVHQRVEKQKHKVVK